MRGFFSIAFACVFTSECCNILLVGTQARASFFSNFFIDKKMKKVVLVSMFFWIIIPFILISDFYPFFRFGMFSEPIQSNIQTEQFVIMIATNTTKKIVNSDEVDLGEQHFQYLVRYAYYQNKLNLLFETIKKISEQKNKNVKNIYLLRKIYNQKKILIESKEILYIQNKKE